MATNDSDEYSLWESDKKSGAEENVSIAVDGDGLMDEGKTHTFTEFPTSAIDEDDAENETGDTSNLIEKKSAPIWTFEFYKQLFDVDTYVVLEKIKRSLLPWPSRESTRKYVGGNPDMYGPFWICATLVMTIAVCGNLTTLFNRYGDEDYQYTPEFHRLVIAAIIVYSYTFLIPLLVRGVIFCTKIQTRSGYLDILCLYGYSMFVFIPLSLLLLIPNCVVEWMLVAVAAVLSGAAIAVGLWSAVRDENPKSGMILLVFIVVLHFAFAISFRVYFFGSIRCSTPSSLIANVTTGTMPVLSTTVGLNATK